MSYKPSEDLLERLSEHDPALDDVMEFLRGQWEEAVTTTRGDPKAVPVPEAFITESDLDGYAQARDWWPTEPPAQHAFPSVYLLCVNYTEQHPNIGATFMDRLMVHTRKVQAWLEEEGRDPVHPDETPEERKTRLNAEAQRRHRARKHDTPEAAHARAVSAAYQAYLDVCAQRKAVKAKWDEKVADARKAWEDLKQTPPA